jgi:hypothetical protein
MIHVVFDQDEGEYRATADEHPGLSSYGENEAAALEQFAYLLSWALGVQEERLGKVFSVLKRMKQRYPNNVEIRNIVDEALKI